MNWKFFLTLIAGMVFYCSTHAQVGNFIAPADSARLLKMPKVGLDDTSFVIMDETHYAAVFHKYKKEELPVIDFKKEYLRTVSYCIWCSASCEHSLKIRHATRVSTTIAGTSYKSSKRFNNNTLLFNQYY